MLGKNKCNLMGREGLVSLSNEPDYGFLYETSLVKDAKWNIGDRVALPDGRAFRYCKSSGLCNDETAVEFTAAEVQTYNTVVETALIGAKSVVVNGGTHETLTVDCLRGGYAIFYSSVGPAQFRGIIGNTAALTGVDFTVYLDAPLVTQLTAGAGAEVFYNPWAAVSSASNDVTCSKAGMPAASVAAANTYFWVQTWGPCWCPPTNASFADANDRGAYWRHSGAIEGEIANASKNSGLNSTQYAGFLLTKGFTAGPLLMLQVCP